MLNHSSIICAHHLVNKNCIQLTNDCPAGFASCYDPHISNMKYKERARIVSESEQKKKKEAKYDKTWNWDQIVIKIS